MLPRMCITFSLAIALAVFAATATGSSGPTLEQAEAAGWDCNPHVLIVGYFHCAPPGRPSVQDMIEGTNVASISLGVFHPNGTFAGTELLLRADLYTGQPCRQEGLAEWTLLPFGYRACHHFAA